MASKCKSDSSDVLDSDAQVSGTGTDVQYVSAKLSYVALQVQISDVNLGTQLQNTLYYLQTVRKLVRAVSKSAADKLADKKSNGLEGTVDQRVSRMNTSWDPIKPGRVT